MPCAGNPFNRLAALLLALLVCLLGSTGWAEDSETEEPYVPPKHTYLYVEAGKGKLINLEHPVSSVFIADPSVADIQVRSPKLIYMTGKRPGQTTLYAVDELERIRLDATVSVAHNLSQLSAVIKKVAPTADVQLSSVQGRILMTGSVDSIRDAENVQRIAASFVSKPAQIINNVSIRGPTQVNLRVQVAEVARDVTKNMGIKWDTVVTNGEDYLFGMVTGGSRILNTQRDLFQLNTGEGNLFPGSVAAGNLDLAYVVDAMEREGLISILAEPNLTAMSGEPASFLAGGEFPIPVPEDEDTITVRFKQYGVSLSFLPTVLDNGNINLRVRPEVSQLSSAGAITVRDLPVPALTTRRAETTVELGSGQSFVIAGLLSSEITRDLDKVPMLGDIPILGALFRSDRFRRAETELIIIVTPYLVRPVDGHQLALPTDGLIAPTDSERLLHGRTHQVAPQAGPREPGQGERSQLVGPAGFTLE